MPENHKKPLESHLNKMEMRMGKQINSFVICNRILVQIEDTHTLMNHWVTFPSVFPGLNTRGDLKFTQNRESFDYCSVSENGMPWMIKTIQTPV